MDLAAAGLGLEQAAWDLEWEKVAADLELELAEQGQAPFRFRMLSSCSSDKENPIHFHRPCCRMIPVQRHGNQENEHRKDSNGQGFQVPCAVHLPPVQES